MKRLIGLAAILFLTLGAAAPALAQSDAGLTPITVSNDTAPPTGEVDAGSTDGGDAVGPAGAIKNPVVRANPRAVQWRAQEGSDLLARATVSFDCANGNCRNWRVLVSLCYYDTFSNSSICGNETHVRGDPTLPATFDTFSLATGNCQPINGTAIYFTRVKIQKNTNSGWDTRITGRSDKRSTPYNCPIS